MRKEQPLSLLTISFSFFCLIISTAIPLSAAVRHEFQFTLNYALPFFTAEYEHSFQPLLLYGSLINSASEQTLNINEQNQLLFSLGYNFFFNRQNGIEIRFNHSSGSLKGENNDLILILDYIGYQPPAYEPKEYHYQTAIKWPSTEGKIRHSSLTVSYLHNFQLHNAIRLRAGSGLFFSVSSFNFKYLSYSRFILGGHSVLFVDTYMLEAFTKKFFQPGITVSLQLLINLTPKITFMVNPEIVLTPQRKIKLEIADQALHFSEFPVSLTPEELQEIEKTMQLALFDYNGSRIILKCGFLFEF